jgi:hypothetical protein
MADQYVVKDSLGRGASGCAFLAERVCDGAHVVIKQVRIHVHLLHALTSLSIHTPFCLAWAGGAQHHDCGAEAEGCE